MWELGYSVLTLYALYHKRKISDSKNAYIVYNIHILLQLSVQCLQCIQNKMQVWNVIDN